MPFEVPVGHELTARLPSVLEAVYLLFNEGYTATSGSAWTRPALCDEAMRLGRMLAALAPQPEVLGLVALMEIQASRLGARIGRDGAPVTLLEQDRSRWDRLLITHALACLERAGAAPGAVPAAGRASPPATPAPPRAEDTDWTRDRAPYGELVELTGSPIVELNRAVAVAMADGPQAGLAIVDELVDVPALRELPPAAERARGSAGAARPQRRGARGVRAGGAADLQRGRARAAARAGGAGLALRVGTPAQPVLLLLQLAPAPFLVLAALRLGAQAHLLQEGVVVVRVGRHRAPGPVVLGVGGRGGGAAVGGPGGPASCGRPPTRRSTRCRAG